MKRKSGTMALSQTGEGHVIGVQAIMTARVPIIKFIDCGTGIECDLSVENRDGIQKSQILHLVSGIDERFQKLSFLTRDPPIIPPFCTLFEGSALGVARDPHLPWHVTDGTDPVIVVKRVKNYSEYGKGNKESLADLFITLLVKVASVENLWQKGLCASLYQGSWTSKLWDTPYLSVEDFTDLSQNVARAVGREQFKEIYGCIHSSLCHLSSFSDGHIQGHQLVDLLFGLDSVSIVPRQIDTGSNDESKANLPVPLNGHQTKRMRVSKGLKEKQQGEGWRGGQQTQGWKQHGNWKKGKEENKPMAGVEEHN
ncbi:Nucleotidyltransferase family protein [Prunus dulcis]|uniref:Nucleotidyltransferase family protein n=1 Tax=Prunus dulcis TaxID=3755 RepID=A0A4Y1RED8_PRUDU|nr:Nucleotidyltransferase family protein [Prunus dulcis]